MEIDMATLKGTVKFYFCPVCGNLIEMIEDSGNVPVCCGKAMKQLIPGTSDGDKEKHVPVVEVKHDKVHVCIGAEPHPMTEEHHINWVAVQTDKGVYRKTIFPDDTPKACFHIKTNEKVLAVYAYCNIHGLWYTPCCEHEHKS